MIPNKRFQETPLTVEYRDEGEGVKAPILRGYASVFNEWTTLYSGKYLTVREKINQGAFSNAIKEKQDVPLLFNHDRNFVLGRTSSGTLSLKEDSKGLAVSSELLDTPTVRDYVISPAKRGDINGMSFAFRPRRGGFLLTIREDDAHTIYEYEMKDVDLYDVSIVTQPQYKGTSVSIRSLDGIDFEAEEVKIRESLKSRTLFLFNSRLKLAEFSS